MNNHYSAVVVGAGRLASALVHNFPFQQYGISIRAAYDVDHKLVGSSICGIPVYSADRLAGDLVRQPVDVGILTVSAKAANEMAETLACGNVRGIWNFTNVELHPQGGAPVIEDVHFFDSLFSMCCMMNGYKNP